MFQYSGWNLSFTTPYDLIEVSGEVPLRSDTWSKLWKTWKGITGTSRGRKSNMYISGSGGRRSRGPEVSVLFGRTSWPERALRPAWQKRRRELSVLQMACVSPRRDALYLVYRYTSLRHIWGICLYRYVSIWQTDPLKEFSFVLAVSSCPHALHNVFLRRSREPLLNGKALASESSGFQPWLHHRGHLCLCKCYFLSACISSYPGLDKCLTCGRYWTDVYQIKWTKSKRHRSEEDMYGTASKPTSWAYVVHKEVTTVERLESKPAI